MDTSPTRDTGAHLAHNVKQLREARGMSQAQIAKLAGIPRPTWSTLERGDGNPTLSVLLRAAAALQVSLEELVAPPRAAARVYRKGSLTVRRRGRVTVENLLPDPVPGLQLERMHFAPGAGMSGVPHTAGTREYLCCMQGEVQLSAAGDSWTLSEGDVVVFRGDQKHGYRNPGAQPSLAFSVVVLAPG
ncbi:helix-turn-helix transcriptional regulator [Haliangium ochraceum]|uniref:Transcriptional regulator, XRE family n=1 Tax=Haliangium ochraceum (strain DSM 14365 / JCM 11303 / SMP-2) TaxID=502025 RepID=D0LSP1_HALO1|nr:helix-turn-helix transcriptional regulator [Haliangium ochraceum]ACY17263.1 transcriptional regulator, XRE family [Haliangium ochraceum DSM 14365]